MGPAPCRPLLPTTHSLIPSLAGAVVSLGFLRHIFQNISRLTVQRPAYGLQRGEAHGLGLAVLQHRQIGKGNVHLSRQLRQAHFPSGHHHVQIHYDSHLIFILSSIRTRDRTKLALNGQIILLLVPHGLIEDAGQHLAEQSCDYEHQYHYQHGDGHIDDAPHHRHQGDEKAPVAHFP